MHTLRNFSVVRGEEKRSTASTHRAGKSRRAISPVIATIILIAITIVIAVAVAGWVFGLFGSYSRTNAVTVVASASSCTATGKFCTIELSNQGGATVTVVSASMDGQTVNPAPTGTVPAGGSAAVVVSFPASLTLTAGQTVDVQLGLSNGNTVTTTLVVSS